MTKTFEVREMNVTVTYGYKVSETKKQFGVFIMPYGLNTYICDTEEEANTWIKNNLHKFD